MQKTIDRQNPSEIQKDKEKRKAGIQKKSVSASALKKGKKAYKPKMTVPVNFDEVIEMNEKALKIIAKRA